jgi:hypothetical protein
MRLYQRRQTLRPLLAAGLPASIDAMSWMILFRRAVPAAVTLLGMTVLVAVAIAEEELIFKPSSDYCAEIDGADATDAKFFVTEPRGRLLVALPSLSTNVIVALKAKKAMTLASSSIKREVEPASLVYEDGSDSGESERLVVQLPRDAPISVVSMEGSAWSFHISDAEVRILKASDCQKAVAPVVPIEGQELVLQACDAYCAEIDGAYAPNARFFTTEPKGRLLVDLPSLSTSTLLALKAQKMVILPPSSFKLEANGSKRLVEPVSAEAPVASLSMGGTGWTFKVRDSEVRVLKASDCHPVVTSLPPEEPLTDDPTAKKCLRQDARPIPETAGCTKGVFLRNNCDVPVLALVQTTQHLFSGTLPQTSTVVIPPRADYALGCAWSRGAMGPENYDVIAAAFATKPTRPKPGGRGSAGR